MVRMIRTGNLHNGVPLSYRAEYYCAEHGHSTYAIKKPRKPYHRGNHKKGKMISFSKSK